MTPHPSSTWRDDFSEEELLRWIREVSGPFRRDARDRGDRDAFASLYTDDFVAASNRRIIGSPEIQGDLAVEAMWDFSQTFPTTEVDVVRVSGTTLLRRGTMSDELGNEVAVLYVQKFRGGRTAVLLSYDLVDEEAALADFDRLAAEC